MTTDYARRSDLMATERRLSREYRPSRGIEIRNRAGSDSPGTIFGYAIKFNSKSDVLRDKRSGKEFVERFQAGAFGDSLHKSDVRCLLDHDTSKVIGRSTAGTLRLGVDSVGLAFECDLPPTSAGRDAAVSIRRKDLVGCSIGFYAEPDGDSWDLTSRPSLRTVTRARVDDISICAFPAYVDTSVALRSMERAAAVDPSVKREHERDRDLLLLMSAGYVPAVYRRSPDDPVRIEHERDRDMLMLLGAY